MMMRKRKHKIEGKDGEKARREGSKGKTEGGRDEKRDLLSA